MGLRSRSFRTGVPLTAIFYPSFAQPLLEVKALEAVKVWGYCRGLRLEATGGLVRAYHGDEKCLDYAELLLGLWIDPPSLLRYVEPRYRGLAEELVATYEGMGVATSPADDVELFVSIFLSRNTSFHVNVIKWVRRALHLYGSLTELADEGKARAVASSYQVLQLPRALVEYLRVRERLLGGAAPEVRQALLRVSHVGPKVAHAYILFTLRDPHYAPVDRNLLKFLSNFEETTDLVEGTAPRKELCLKYECWRCPAAQRCVHSKLAKAFGALTGWVQTVAYTHSGLFCRARRCSDCRLIRFCVRGGGRRSE